MKINKADRLLMKDQVKVLLALKFLRDFFIANSEEYGTFTNFLQIWKKTNLREYNEAEIKQILLTVFAIITMKMGKAYGGHFIKSY